MNWVFSIVPWCIVDNIADSIDGDAQDGFQLSIAPTLFSRVGFAVILSQQATGIEIRLTCWRKSTVQDVYT